MAADPRALLRAAAASDAARTTHPAAAYAADGALLCKVCSARVKGAFAAHLSSREHKQQLQQLRERAAAAEASEPSAAAAGGAQAASSAPAAAPAASAPSASALPEGFFDDARADARARGVDWRAAERARKEQELSEFLGWASEVTREGEAEAAAEEERYEERAEAAEAEAALGRARVAVLKDLVHEGRAVGAEREGEAEGGGAGAAGAAPAAEGGVTVHELTALLAAAKRPLAAQEGGAGVEEEEEEEGDLLDWRRKRARR